jgi:hypothetical protein
MKIQKFNESASKKWMLEEIKNLFILKKEIEEKERNIRKYLDEFLFFNYKLLPNDISSDVELDFKNGYTLDQTDAFYVDNFYFKDSILVANIIYDDGDEQKKIKLEQEEVEDFIYFLNDPEIYKSAKKYNL